MKVIFGIDGISYVSPTKKEAKKFVSFWPHLSYRKPERIKISWRLKHIEKAPSYAQMMSLDLSQVEYGKAS